MPSEILTPKDDSLVRQATPPTRVMHELAQYPLPVNQDAPTSGEPKPFLSPNKRRNFLSQDGVVTPSLTIELHLPLPV